MKLAYYIKKESLSGDPRTQELFSCLQASGSEVYPASAASDLKPGTDALLSIGGDGTFLDAARIAVPSGVPILGVNFGRLGFLSENSPESIVDSMLGSGFEIEERTLLQVTLDGAELDFWPYALNETSVARVSASMLGVDVEVDGSPLPTYWADGLLVATSSGSTAYSLSVGGPICTPDTKVFIVAPVSPHNLNVRPLIVPETSVLRISLRSRDDSAVFTMDNRNYTIPAGARLEVCAAPVRLARLRPGKSNFINALRTKLHWGDDLRNDLENN